MWLKRYYPEILVFGAVFAGLMVACLPALSWMMVNSDVGANILASKFLYPEHGTGEPLSSLLGRLFLFIPFGSDSWRMAVMAVLSTIGGMLFVYLTVKELLKDNQRRRTYATVGALIFGSAMLVVSQAIIVQLYALITMLCLGSFYFVVKKRWLLSAVMIGAGLAVHHLILIPWIVLLISHKEMRRWKTILVSLSFLVFYLYMPVATRLAGVDYWANSSISDFFRTNLGTANLLIGGLAVWDFPARLFSTMGMLVVSFGLATIPLIWWLWKTKKWKSELLWLFALPIVYYVVHLAPDTMKYAEQSIGFGAIIAALGLSKLNIKWVYAVAGVAITLLAFNVNYFDVGRTLDPNLSAQKFYDEELPKIPDGQIYLTNTGWAWQMSLLYNKNENRHIIPVCIGTLTGEPYLVQLERQGVKLVRNDSDNMNERQATIAKSILRLNPNVWMDVVTTPSTYGNRVIKGDSGQIDDILTHTGPSTPSWKFKPSNPYDMVTGSIQVDEWNWETLSNWNMRFFIGLGSIGLILNWLLFVLPAKRLKEIDAESK